MIDNIICAPLYTKSYGFVPRGAIAIQHNRIVAVGDAAHIRTYATARTRIETHPDTTILIPSFCDSHQHFLSYIRGRVERLSLWDATSLYEVFRRVQTRTNTLSPHSWIIADGHDQGRYREQRHPTLAELDAIAPNHPLLIHRACHHIALANSCALAIAGITSQTAQPDGGRIGKLSDGSLSGILEESARALVTTHIQLPEIAWYDHIPSATFEYHKRGITAIGEAAIGHINGLNDLHVMQTAHAAGQLPLRVSYMGYGEVAHAWLRNEHRVIHDDWQNAPIIKYFVDGTLGGESAWLSQPYRHSPTNVGYSLYSDDMLCHAVAQAHTAGYQVAIHAIGDAAVAQVLDAYAHVLAKHPRHDHRHRIEHVEVIRAGLPVLFKQHNIIAAVQPLFTWFEESDVAQVPDDLMPYAHAWKMLADQGVQLAFGSDNPVVPDFTPVKGIAAAIQRCNYSGKSINPSQALPWQQALNAYTIESAWSIRREDLFGDLLPGMAADFVILDNQFTCDDIASINVLETWLDGQCVFRA
ncbi:MAG: amidohydrolase [Chloroflexi bacterium]|nr:amidohydrolase [Chloroflexota bacterium]